MKVGRAKALRAEVAGQSFYFCSERCLHVFEADPRRAAPTNVTTRPLDLWTGDHSLGSREG